jgi:hypothetical protein
LVYEGKYGWHDGWRKARVVRSGTAEELGGRHFSDCRYREVGEKVSTAQFVVLSYEHMSRPRRRVVPLTQGEAYFPGDLVYMNLRSCDARLARRSSVGN